MMPPRIQVVKCRCRWREVEYILSTTNASDWHASEPGGASNRGNKHGHRSSTPGFTDSEHTCMAGYSGPGPKAWIDQCSGEQQNNSLPPVNWRWVEEGDGYVGRL
jgi:hypothetical protein